MVFLPRYNIQAMINLLLFLKECECNPDGSTSNDCNPVDGKCPCNEHIVGDHCDTPEPGFFDFPDPKRKLFTILFLKYIYFCPNSSFYLQHVLAMMRALSIIIAIAMENVLAKKILLGISATNVQVDSTDSQVVKVLICLQYLKKV